MITGYPAAVGTYQIFLAAPSTSNGSAVVQKNARHRLTAKHPVATSTTGGGSMAVLTLNVVAPALSLPRLTSQPAGDTALQNSEVTLIAIAVGAPPPSYQWSRNGVPISGAAAAALTLSPVQPADAGIYTLTATNTAGQVVSVPAALTVQQTYAAWQTAHFTAAEINEGFAADDYDGNGDGVPNLIKYALGIDPINGTGGSLPAGTYSTADRALQLTFTRDTARTDIDYVVEASPDLSQWTPIASSTAGSPTVNLGGALSIVEGILPGTSQVTVMVKSGRVSNALDQQFLRLRVTRP